ncbi:MAG: winged helix DNA-binding protein [Dehalococcoidales bacterium]|nr:winged helix DNA-binding protein [Dehalococcoidales bacterium]
MINANYVTTGLTDVQICGKLCCAQFAIYKLREMELANFGLNVEQSSILHFISERGGATTIKEIIDKTMRQPNSVYILLNKMVKMGLIHNRRGNQSKSTLISITEHGKSLLEKITSISLEEIFSVLREKDRVILFDILNRLLTRSRYLLGIGYVAPIAKLLNSEVPQKAKPKYNKHPSVNALWSILNNTRFAISRLRELELTKFELTMEQSSILHIIVDHGGTVTIKEIIDETMHQPNSVYILLNRMKKMGLIYKTEQKKSGSSLISLTEDGESLLKKITNITFKETISRLKAAEKAKFVEILYKIIDKSGELLGINFQPPIMQYLEEANQNATIESARTM